jgi:putative glutamine amidotransferase
MAIIIGVTAGEIYNKIDPWAPVTYGQSRTYTDSIIAAKGVPLILPLTDDKKMLRSMYDKLDGLLVSGGNDVNPKLYNQEVYEATKDFSDYRDQYEQQLITWALEDKKPILAICRGVQFLNVVCGGDLYQDIPTDLPEAEDHNRSTSLKDTENLAHTLTIKPNSKLADILGTINIQTNTHHHQAIKTVAESLEAVAWSSDGVIEAVEGDGPDFVIGIQSHPESLMKRAETKWQNLFSSFVLAAGKKSQASP